MKVTGVRVEIIKRLSDGNYGFEQFNAQYIAELEDDEDPDAAIRELAQRGRANVVGQLAESESSRIRWALEPPRQVEERDQGGDEDEEGDADYEDEDTAEGF